MAQKMPPIENVGMNRSKGSGVDLPDSDVARASEEGAARTARHEEALAERLRTYYSELVAEPLPDQFLALLAQLEAMEIEK